ncbi:OLC1v1003858C1 [Oldenlandia corymbosa var. corymbosa]|uniref:OLC1v1003858C1 n=1 Tax=Oldenlandia corymbosa var. corymbosa TaxID=529605 RepID=A0AAV1DAX7_OLDCO|nr:OLC1v1003858C1 [Oldenlandia corymbosa var. corymbosa]
MGNFILFSFFTSFTVINVFLSSLATAVPCGGSCKTLNDCDGQLICINGKCNDDPEVGTHFCPGSATSGGGSCLPSGSLRCNGQTKPTYTCSPPVNGSTPATLTLNDFSAGEDGGSQSECDQNYHSNSERLVALSTGWYSDGARCGRMIRITASNGRSTTAKVVGECDSRHGCDAARAFEPPCDNNVVDGSDGVWKALGLNEDLGRVQVTWSMA